MHYPWANVLLLILLIFQLVTGVAGLVSGAERFGWILQLHSFGSYALLGLLFWKGAVVVDSWRRRRKMGFPRWGFAGLLGLLLGTLATGLLWTFTGPRYLWAYSLMVLHGFMAVALSGLLGWHVLYMGFIFRVPEAADRRAFLRLTGFGLAGLGLWQLAGLGQTGFELPGAARRFTGSYETGSFSGHFPPTSWLFDNPPPPDPQRWRLVITGAVARPLSLTYDELAGLADDTVTETLDCTGGWYSTQEWRGVRLGRLLDMAGVRAGARSVTVEAVSGYGRRFSLAEVREYLLATQVAGQPLSHGHGFPARLVALERRGFEWVKWVTRIRVNETSKYWQSPLPLQ